MFAIYFVIQCCVCIGKYFVCLDKLPSLIAPVLLLLYSFVYLFKSDKLGGTSRAPEQCKCIFYQVTIFNEFAWTSFCHIALLSSNETLNENPSMLLHQWWWDSKYGTNFKADFKVNNTILHWECTLQHVL